MKKIISAFFFLILFFLFLLFPQEVKSGALDGLFLWYNSVVPILLPFLILSDIIIKTDSLSFFLLPLFRIKKFIPSFNPALIYPVFLGLFCGFPMGAKTIADLTEKGEITVKEADRFLPVVNQASPMFLAGFVGVHILKKHLSLPEILFYLYVPPFLFLFGRTIFAFLFSYLPFSAVKSELKHKRESHLSFAQKSKGLKSGGFSYDKKNSMSLNMEHTIWNSFHIVVTIVIYMMLFNILSRLCIRLLPTNNLFVLLLTTLEFSTGLNQLSTLSFTNPVIKTGLILSLTSFGGFCTAAQTKSLIKDTELSINSYLMQKMLIAAAVFLFYSSSASS